ncbi:MAG: Mrp/NBP35 family ATP-binding protein [Gemmatimonadota bacterium]|nr:Mrp/NBP35 family ATP-binding protein [Gemmatimonadota bacterium]MDH5758128.1 Mrp/NBP35 family ATP-binding protein [Gemmatimonadota bacterium]
MNVDELQRSVLSALSQVRGAGSDQDVVSAGQVQGVEVAADGSVRFGFQLRAQDSGDLVKAVRAAAEGVAGEGKVKVNVQLPQTSSTPPGRGPQPGSVPAPTPKPGVLSGVAHVVAVSSGKGGVGKSMVSANLAASFAKQGLRVGLLDADIYGPNIPLMFGETRRPSVSGEKGREMIEPLEAHGVRLMSLGFLLDKEQPAIMRGPLITGILRQFLEQVDWGDLDVMVVDMPPGTGDAQLSLVQSIDVDGVVMVTTPQDVATGDVRRGVKMFERVNTRVLGIVENMSGYLCPHCGEEVDIFGRGGGESLAAEMKLEFLGKVPLDPAVSRAGDAGTPTVVGSPESPAGSALTALASDIRERLVRGS